ncbi:MAG: efflux RND transporter periplasmic adaptor subunit [Bacteroidia bacterium]|nr:efflux RND transporter periplasmic adaptor subunit [Bacteroidia bacterium]
MKNLHIISSLILIILLSACGGQKQEPTEESSVELPSLEADKDTSRSAQTDSPVTANLELFGQIDVPPNFIRETHSKVSAYVTSVKVLEGQRVSAGQLLIELDSPEFLALQEEFLTAKADFELYAAAFQRKEKLMASNSIPQREFEEAQHQYKTSKASYEGKGERLRAMGFDVEKIEASKWQKKLSIYADMSGILTKLNVSPGQHIGPDTHLLTLVDMSHVHVEIDLPTQDIGRLKEGDRFSMYRTNGEGPIEGKIHLVNSVLDDRTNAVRVHGHLEGVTQHLIVGERMMVKMKN